MGLIISSVVKGGGSSPGQPLSQPGFADAHFSFTPQKPHVYDQNSEAGKRWDSSEIIQGTNSKIHLAHSGAASGA